MASFVLGFRHIDKTKIGVAGGKGANLGELGRIGGINVPDGFCISTEAFKRIIKETPLINELLDRISLLKVQDRHMINTLTNETRQLIEEISIPADIKEEITDFITLLGAKDAYAIRSSATAEDLPSTSFAGQQDTYLNIIGQEAILKHISKCWASLFTSRAVTYRIQNGFDHHLVQLSVIVQKMVFPQSAGILFTADPLTSNRKVISIDAGFGLGEAMVSGMVNTDLYKVCNNKIIDKKIPPKKLAVYPLKDGGTKTQEIAPEMQNKQVLTDEHILQLAQIGRKIEEHFGQPQDIEWCLADDIFHIVQSRPITTLYPIPTPPDDRENHVYISVGHQQMMTDAMKPLGLSLWQLTAFRPMFKAGGRLFVDVTQNLASPAGRKAIIEAMGAHDPLIKDALLSITEREDFIRLLPGDNERISPVISSTDKSSTDILAQIENDAAIVTDLIKRSEKSIEELKQSILTKSGTALFDFILEDGKQSKNILFDPQNMKAIMASIDASLWLNESIKTWLGEKNAADTLAQSAPNNITSQMGLDLLDVADAIRPYPEVIEYLQHVKDDEFPDKLIGLEGGRQAYNAIYAYLYKYGMRCTGEIDITRTRWSEDPTTLFPLIHSNIKNFAPNAGKLKLEHGQQQAAKKEEEILNLLKQLPDGEQKALETKQMIAMLRNFAGYREYPKYSIVSRFFVYKQALLREAERLLQANVINEKEDIYYLTFDELREIVRTNKSNQLLISQRKEEHKLYEKLNPPRVITSDGEIITAQYKHEDLPAGAIAGLAVSSGIAEGRARVILNMEHADIEEGDILVTSFTDPGWTPLFVSIKGLVTEVGGLMTHGAVIAREYGLPAVVGVAHATSLIKDGQRIRVNGTDGYVELL